MSLQNDQKLNSVPYNKKTHLLFIIFLVVFFPAGILYINYRLNKYFMTKYPSSVNFRQPLFSQQPTRFLESSYKPGTYDYIRIHGH